MDATFDVDDWTRRLAVMQADPRRTAHNERANERRREIVPDIVDLLQRFISQAISVEAFRAEFDSRSRVEWEGFGFKGMSGAMFLNKLVKSLDAGELGEALRAVLAVPPDEAEAKRRMRGFADFLEEQIASGKATRRELHPARTPFLVSSFWHLQHRETWPIYYQSGRSTLRAEKLVDGDGTDPVADYFEFRRVYLSIANRLGIDSWTCEHLLDWLNQGGDSASVSKPPIGTDSRKAAGNSIVPPHKGDEETDDDKPIDPAEEGTHTHVQWLLAEIGRKLRCQVWVASNDRGKTYRGRCLGDGCLPELPRLGLDDDSQDIVRLIDVVWIKGDRQIVAAFEIEHTTSIFSGLLRMADLVTLSPNLNFPLYIVAPESRLEKVRRQLSRPAFRALELHKLCEFFSDEALLAAADGILNWADDPSAIRRLAQRVSDS